jgi:hypothetical protein
VLVLAVLTGRKQDLNQQDGVVLSLVKDVVPFVQ